MVMRSFASHPQLGGPQGFVGFVTVGKRQEIEQSSTQECSAACHLMESADVVVADRLTDALAGLLMVY
ncbi:hypothetical protein P691DRAFT_805053 [Macrolepiota fuliginosa MF-IS2]|uniref:Uncharacterized protein n=1 Tax=Macrolepiota fuliginosa MF-IS2 TaxID=1400762 RepID=A0A9P5X7G8_9AGAR|nr:hypothetical protein P691DRAFT_805053 [Macrolepiota fuliginosa MF-IS2]